MAVFFNSNGNQVKLGEKIGSGGEGNVYKIVSTNKTAAKVWHERKPKKKQNKITIMAKSATNSLKKVTAWPLDTLHRTRNGEVCGFIMPDITGYSKLHDFYNPSNRKKKHPDIDWEFLVSICRNIAASFATIHAQNHVIGDVNPGLIFVSNKTVTKFVDCDSFQIIHNGETYPCRVGVQNFTPPELQKTKDFSKVLRTKNHDNFGLALLMFHILMMGRHPFSGVYSGKVDMELRESIQKYLYAYSKKSSTSAKIKPPPKSLAINILPNEIQLFFEKAFSQSGSLFNRPTAEEWIKALDSFRSKLKKCNMIGTHVYYNKLSSCPWCLLEKKGVGYFKKESFNIDKVWGDIKSITPVIIPKVNFNQNLNKIKITMTPKIGKVTFPKLFKVFKKTPFSILVLKHYKAIIPRPLKTLMPKPLIFSSIEKNIIKKEAFRKNIAIFITPIIIATTIYLSLSIELQIIEFIFILILFTYKTKKEIRLTKRKKKYEKDKNLAQDDMIARDNSAKLAVTRRTGFLRLSILSPIDVEKSQLSIRKTTSESSLKNLIHQWGENSNTSKNPIYKKLRSSLKSPYLDYKNLKSDYNSELNKITSKAYDYQFNYYMRNTYIRNWKIKGVGPKKERDLSLHGIQTANDISRWAVDRVPGFGEKHTQTMLNWKYQMENSFTFNPNKAITPSQDKRLKGKYLKIKLSLEQKFIDARTQLKKTNKNRLQKNNDLLLKINKAMYKSAQADVNWEEFNRKYTIL